MVTTAAVVTSALVDMDDEGSHAFLEGIEIHYTHPRKFDDRENKHILDVGAHRENGLDIFLVRLGHLVCNVDTKNAHRLDALIDVDKATRNNVSKGIDDLINFEHKSVH